MWGMRRGRRTRERIEERVSQWAAGGVRVDVEGMRVCDVVLVGRESRNGYVYTEEALRNAVGLYEGRPVFLDHAPRGQRPLERSARDLVGTIREVKYEEGRIRGSIDVVDTESGRTFLAMANAGASHVGMSHVVLACRSRDGSKVFFFE
ncbi:MAG: hypothetical protein KDA78_07815 [Planctomycetaceae bacterium]|nr:hypothetical protein [Planctomycetaceae bacterium]